MFSLLLGFTGVMSLAASFWVACMTPHNVVTVMMFVALFFVGTACCVWAMVRAFEPDDLP